ncbi:MAG: glycosyltransferase, partial [Planctomycetaceae bacterium]
MILRTRRATITVLMTTDTVGGVWSYALELCRALAPHDVQIVLATKGARLTRDQELAVGRLENVTVAASTYRLEWMADPWDDLAAADRWLRDLADGVQPDVVHLNDFAHGSLAWEVPVLIVGHSCVLSWHRAVRRC